MYLSTSGSNQRQRALDEAGYVEGFLILNADGAGRVSGRFLASAARQSEEADRARSAESGSSLRDVLVAVEGQ
jgi:hypothetical protein